MSSTTFHLYYTGYPEIYVMMRLASELSVDVAIGGSVSGPCPVSVTLLKSVKSHTVKPESKEYQVILSITLLI